MMNPQIVKDIVDDIIRTKAQRLIDDGIIVANYEEVRKMLLLSGYSEVEIQNAIRELVNSKLIKCGKHYHGKDEQGQPIYKGWLRSFKPHLDK